MYNSTPQISSGLVAHTPKTIITANGRTVGNVTGNLFTKTVSASQHFLRTPRAICIDAQSLADAEAAGATEIEITDDETNNFFWIDIETFKSKSVSIDNDGDQQFAIAIDRWRMNSTPTDDERRADAEIKKLLADNPQLDLIDVIDIPNTPYHLGVYK